MSPSAIKFITPFFYFQKTIESGHQAVLKVTVKTEKPDEVVEGDVWVESEFERLSFALQMKVVDGKIKVINQPVKFSDCFPVSFLIFLQSISLILPHPLLFRCKM